MGTYFDQLVDISYLYSGERKSIESSYIKTFATFPDLVQRVLMTNDKDMSIKIKIVEKYGEKLPGYVSMIRYQLSIQLKFVDRYFRKSHYLGTS